MTEFFRIDGLLRRVRGEIRRCRAEYYGIRGVFWGAVAAIVVLLVKYGIGSVVLWIAGALVVVGVCAGIMYGLVCCVGYGDVVCVVDCAFGFDDRVVIMFEWVQRADRMRLVDSLVVDIIARVESFEMKWVVRCVVPCEGRFLLVLILVCLLLVVILLIPLLSPRLLDFLLSGEEEKEDRAISSMLEELSCLIAKDQIKRASFEERDFAQRAGGIGAAMIGDLLAIFKDTSLASQWPDFNSFMKKGDERFRMLEQVDRLLDLQSDFMNNQYKMVFCKSKALTSGLRLDQISLQKLRELLEEMERFGCKGGNNWSGDAMEGMEAFEGGQFDRVFDVMQRVLDKMRVMDEVQRSGKGLRGGCESDRSGRGRDRACGDGMGPEDQDFGEGEGLMFGKGRSNSPKGEASQCLCSMSYDVGVEGELR